jgi:hypothetical protein
VRGSVNLNRGIKCLNPLYPAVAEDCFAICKWLGVQAKYITIGPLKIVEVSWHTCKFGLRNLNPCTDIGFPMANLTPYCKAMLDDCMINQYDGFLSDQIAGVDVAYALYGPKSAPPYAPGEC